MLLLLHQITAAEKLFKVVEDQLKLAEAAAAK
jgi:hypothetical protein